jgi:hypothetical protein
MSDAPLFVEFIVDPAHQPPTRGSITFERSAGVVVDYKPCSDEKLEIEGHPQPDPISFDRSRGVVTGWDFADEGDKE